VDRKISLELSCEYASAYALVLGLSFKPDLVNVNSFATALPTIGLFGLKLRRFPQLIGVLVYFLLGATLILRWKSTWYRNILQTMAFHIFLMWVHYMRENVSWLHCVRRHQQC
jgi:hypothetical protein